MKFDGFIFFVCSLLILILVQRLLQREIQIIFLLITRKPNVAMGLFSFLLLPGVFIHEVSHLIMAIILGVPVRKISLLPDVSKQGKIRLGFVQTSKSDVFRDSLIGLAPFIIGLICVGLIGENQLGFRDLITFFYEGNGKNFLLAFRNLRNVPDFGLWLYLAFAISTTMIPSESDRQSWKLIILGIALILSLVLIAGLGDWMVNNIYPNINQWLFSISFILAGSVLVHIIILVPTWIFRQVLLRILGLRIN